MITPWHNTSYSLGYYLGDKRIFSKKFNLCACEIGPVKDIDSVNIADDKPALTDSQDGYMIRSLPIAEAPERLTYEGDFIHYTPNVYKRYYADLNSDFDTYIQSFSSKTRSTIKRKVKKFAAHSNGEIDFREYKTADELNQFFQIAIDLSSKTYQENLLGVGLPTSKEYQQKILESADKNQIRAYLLFHESKAIAYLFLTSRGTTLLYSYLGYDPDYMKWSAGTVLNWLAFESILNENEQTFSMLDFTDGESQQKRTFSTGSVTCANTFLIRRSFTNRCLLLAHLGIDKISQLIGTLLNKVGLKAKIRKVLRHGLARHA